MPANYRVFALKQELNSRLGEARAVDRIINSHSITRIPVEVIREILEAVAHTDLDALALLSMTCMAWY